MARDPGVGPDHMAAAQRLPRGPISRLRVVPTRQMHPVGAESFESEVYDEPPWPSDEKVVAEELGSYLATLSV